MDPRHFSYLLGGLLGLGVVLIYYGWKRFRDAEKPQPKLGLILVNLGVIAIAASFALTMWRG